MHVLYILLLIQVWKVALLIKLLLSYVMFIALFVLCGDHFT